MKTKEIFLNINWPLRLWELTGLRMCLFDTLNGFPVPTRYPKTADNDESMSDPYHFFSVTRK